MPTFSIGQLSKRAGVAIGTVRYYERNQLLAPAGRLQSGYRRYGDTELKRLRFIRRAKTLGFTLADIRDLLSLSDERNGLKSLVAACPGHGRAEACPILNALNEEGAP